MWYKILNEAIELFLNNTKNIDGYTLRLDDNRGSHVHLGLLVQRDNALLLAQNFDAYLKKFLEEQPSTSIKNLLPNDGFYLDFNNNSIHYGVFDYPIARAPLEVYGVYFQNMALVLLQVFQSYKQNTVTDLVEIMIQLFTIFCNTVGLDNQKAAVLFDRILEIEYKKYTDTALTNIIKNNLDNFENNKEPIIDYLNEYRNSYQKQYDEKWQNSWEQTVKNCCNDLVKIIEVNKMTDAYVFMIDSLCNTFNFKNKTSACYLFSNALKNLTLQSNIG